MSKADFYEYPLYLCDDCLHASPADNPAPVFLADDDGSFYTCLHIRPRDEGALAGRVRTSMTLIIDGAALARRPARQP